MRRHESNLPFGGPAFPFVFDDTKQHHIFTGMTLRDYFAGICLPRAMGMTERWAAKAAYKMADAMLEARES